MCLYQTTYKHTCIFKVAVSAIFQPCNGDGQHDNFIEIFSQYEETLC